MRKELQNSFNISHTAIIQAIANDGTSLGFKWQYCDIFDEDPNSVWIPLEINGYESIEVSDGGKIKTNKGYITKGSNSGKYKYHNLIPLDGSKKYKPMGVHVLILLGFLGENPGKIPNHLNGSKDDNRLENLEYATQRENMQHAAETGLIKSKAVNQYDLEGKFIKKFLNANSASKQIGINKSSISDICKYKAKSLNKRKYLWAFSDLVPEGDLSLDYFIEKGNNKRKELKKLLKSNN